MSGDPNTIPTQSKRRSTLAQIVDFFAQIAIGLMILSVLYVLSIGPMYWQWYDSAQMGDSAFLALFYLPLLYACEIDVVGRFVNWYIELWVYA